VGNLQTINIDKIHKIAKPIWQKHFRHMMSYDAYFEQILRFNIFPYMKFKGLDKRLFLQYKRKIIDMTMRTFGKTKPLGIGNEFTMDDDSGS